MKNYQKIYEAIDICNAKIAELEKKDLTEAVLEEIKWYDHQLTTLNLALARLISCDNLREIMG